MFRECPQVAGVFDVVMAAARMVARLDIGDAIARVLLTVPDPDPPPPT